MNEADELAEAARLLRHMAARRLDRCRAERYRPNGSLLPRRSANAEIASKTLVRELIPGGHGAEFWITYHGMRDAWLRLREIPALAHWISEFGDPEALNGYVAFPKRSAPRLPRNDTGNIVQYIPVHGGVTWACKDGYMAVWGFDSGHHGSEREPRTEPDWIRANCWILYRGLMLAEQLWPQFRRASQQRRAELADQLLALVEEQPLMDKLGFQALISTLFGKVGS